MAASFMKFDKNSGQLTMERDKTEWHDWIGELFTPTINVEVEDILQGVEKDAAVKKKIKRVSVLDPDSVKEVYEKVRMMTVLDEEMKQKGKSEEETSVSKEETSKPGKIEVDLNESCIWSSDEISVLREVFKSVKEENKKLCVKIRELQKRNTTLEQRHNGLVTQVDEKDTELKEVKKSNLRLKIHCNTLQSELDQTNARMTAMEQIFKEINEEKGKMVREVHEMRVKNDKDRMERNQIQLKLDILQQEALSEKMAAEESIKIQCQGEILKLEQQVRDLTSELNKERKLHRTTKKGLDHLRKHFASLPLSNIIPPNSVRLDQVSDIQY